MIEESVSTWDCPSPDAIFHEKSQFSNVFKPLSLRFLFLAAGCNSKLTQVVISLEIYLISKGVLAIRYESDLNMMSLILHNWKSRGSTDSRICYSGAHQGNWY